VHTNGNLWLSQGNGNTLTFDRQGHGGQGYRPSVPVEWRDDRQQTGGTGTISLATVGWRRLLENRDLSQTTEGSVTGMPGQRGVCQLADPVARCHAYRLQTVFSRTPATRGEATQLADHDARRHRLRPNRARNTPPRGGGGAVHQRGGRCGAPLPGEDAHRDSVQRTAHHQGEHFAFLLSDTPGGTC